MEITPEFRVYHIQAIDWTFSTWQEDGEKHFCGVNSRGLSASGIIKHPTSTSSWSS
jgi:hypothetical protein